MVLNFFRPRPTEPEKPLGGRYQVVDELGSGGFGQTFLAIDLHLPDHPRCVVKQLKPLVRDAGQMQVARRLFDTEAKVLYRLGSHDQIPRLLAHFEENQEFYLAQELIDGHSLSQELSPQPWSEIKVVAMLSDLLSVLTFVHQNNVIHRDIKPSNLIRRQHDGKIVLIDFGAVKQASTQLISSNTGTHTISIGTQGYMPNEQLSGNPRYSSDIYAVGVVGIQALTGKHPTQIAIDPNTCELNWHDRAPQTSPELVALLDRMVRYDFRTRYATASEALEALATLPTELQSAAAQIQSSLGAAYPADQPTADWDSAEVNQGSTAHWTAKSADRPAPHPGTSPTEPSSRLRRTAKTVAIPGYTQAPSRSVLPIAVALVATIGLGFVGLKTVFPGSPAQTSAIADDSTPPSSPTRSAEPPTEVSSSPTAESPPDSATSDASPTPQEVAARSQSAATDALATADRLREAKNYQDALASYDQAIAENADSSAAHWGRCYVLNKLQEFTSAVTACDRALAIDPENPDALWSKGYALEQQQQPQTALDLYDQAIAIDPNHAEAWNNRGTALYQLGRLDKAFEAFDKATQIDGDLAEAWSNRGAALWELRRFDEAIVSIDRAIQLEPDNAVATSLRQQMRDRLGK